jgi:hypothetical protein
MSSKASGNCILNHERIWSLSDNVSNSVVGANNVQVNDLSCITQGAGWRQHSDVPRQATDFVGQCYEHERVPWPYMQMIRFKEESRTIMIVSTRWDLKFKVFVRDVFLLKIHATEECGVSSELVRTQRAPKRERYRPDDPHQLTSYD